MSVSQPPAPNVAASDDGTMRPKAPFVDRKVRIRTMEQQGTRVTRVRGVMMARHADHHQRLSIRTCGLGS